MFMRGSRKKKGQKKGWEGREGQGNHMTTVICRGVKKARTSAWVQEERFIAP
jgi:hypothetical protein